MNKILKTTFSLLSFLVILAGAITPEAKAYGVCGLEQEAASFKTTKRLVTICYGEASLQMVITYYNGTGYVKVSATREGDKFSGSNSQNNYIIDSKRFILGTDGEKPIRENVIEANM